MRPFDLAMNLFSPYGSAVDLFDFTQAIVSSFGKDRRCGFAFYAKIQRPRRLDKTRTKLRCRAMHRISFFFQLFFNRQAVVNTRITPDVGIFCLTT